MWSSPDNFLQTTELIVELLRQVIQLIIFAVRFILQKEEEERRVTWKEDCALSTMQNASSGKTGMKVGLADLGEVAVDSIREAQQRIEAMQFLLKMLIE